jgi:hypothetical protein
MGKLQKARDLLLPGGYNLGPGESLEIEADGEMLLVQARLFGAGGSVSCITADEIGDLDTEEGRDALWHRYIVLCDVLFESLHDVAAPEYRDPHQRGLTK